MPSALIIMRYELAELIGISPRQLTVWVEKGYLPIGSISKLPMLCSHIVDVINESCQKNGLRPLDKLPREFLAPREIAWAMSVTPKRMLAWAERGCPCYWFSPKSIRFVMPEVKEWLTNIKEEA